MARELLFCCSMNPALAQTTLPLLVLGLGLPAVVPWEPVGSHAMLFAATLVMGAPVLAWLQRRGAAGARAHAHDPSAELETLRQYVPGPIADCISDGESLETGESEVTVMFLDLRGYTAFSESLSPAEVFSFLNEYTQSVSRIVRRHGGFVVEFNGDGMMAVFGAPVAIHQKERAAIDAARGIVDAVADLAGRSKAAGSRDGAKASDGHRIGVGIATGPAYVGNIRAVDRVIWSAVGSTTNRASRLQGLTRSLDASIVVDEATWRRSRAGAEFARHARVAITGLAEPIDLFARPQLSPRRPGRGAFAPRQSDLGSRAGFAIR